MKTSSGKNINLLKGDINLENKFISINGISPVLASILSKNKTLNLDNLEDFLNPKLKNLLPNPKKLFMMDRAILKICDTIEKKDKIGILGDYDVDGVSSSAMMKIFLSWLGIDPYIIIPDRFKDGYGPSVSLFEKMHREGIDTIITLDCGTIAFEPIEHAVNLGMSVIVIDHHISKEEKPKAAAIVNPNQIGDESGLGYLCAAGVTFLFCVGINSELKNREFFKEKNPPSLINLVPFAMLGSVCDMMKMIGLNRAFFRTGIEVLSENLKNFEKLDSAVKMSVIGFCELMKVGKIDAIKTTYDLGFIIGPMINAGGRLESGAIGVDLLTSNNQEDAKNFAEKLFEINQNRKDIQNEILEDAKEKADKIISLGKNVLFLISEEYNEGVVGIVASKIKEIYHKTTIIGAIKNIGDTKIIKASCRSIDGVDIGSSVLKSLENGLILKGGGHIAAAGFSAKLDDFDKLYDFFEKDLTEDSINSEKSPKIDIHATLDVSQITDKLSEIKKLEPFGIENPKPNFLIKSVILIDYKILKEIHYKIFFRSEERVNDKYIWQNAMFFGCHLTKIGESIKANIGKKVDIACNIDFNSYGISIIGIDIVPH